MAQIPLRYFLYDTWQPAAVANAESILFQVASGGDATHNEQFTNMRGAGSLPQTEQMEVDWIGVIVDSVLAKADLVKWIDGALLEIRVADFSVIKAPVALFIAQSAFGGTQIQAAAADSFTIGYLGDGFELDKHIMLPGGTPFKVRMLQGPALAGTSNMKVVLGGIYTVSGQG